MMREMSAMFIAHLSAPCPKMLSSLPPMGSKLKMTSKNAKRSATNIHSLNSKGFCSSTLSILSCLVFRYCVGRNQTSSYIKFLCCKGLKPLIFFKMPEKRLRWKGDVGELKKWKGNFWFCFTTIKNDVKLWYEI